jgi:hypothetical protein
MFYVFARLDPYEQAELIERTSHNAENAATPATVVPVSGARIATRARRVSTP